MFIVLVSFSAKLSTVKDIHSYTHTVHTFNNIRLAKNNPCESANTKKNINKNCQIHRHNYIIHIDFQ